MVRLHKVSSVPAKFLSPSDISITDAFRSCTQFDSPALILFQIARVGVESQSAERAWDTIDRLYSRNHSTDNNSEGYYTTYCASEPGHGQYIPESILSSPLQRLLQVARSKQTVFPSNLTPKEAKLEISTHAPQEPGRADSNNSSTRVLWTGWKLMDHPRIR
jgi:hypothetical protein